MNNLYDPARVIPFTPTLRHTPDRGSEHVPACWGPPRVAILEGTSTDYVADHLVNPLLADPDVHVVAVSPATIAMSGNDGYQWLAITVIYQTRQRQPESAEAA